jgi:hypothetical protein
MRNVTGCIQVISLGVDLVSQSVRSYNYRGERGNFRPT